MELGVLLSSIQFRQSSGTSSIPSYYYYYYLSIRYIYYIETNTHTGTEFYTLHRTT
nr:MAG TPA: hypothetical protein [Caudoviricetes sp.]